MVEEEAGGEEGVRRRAEGKKGESEKTKRASTEKKASFGEI